MTKLAFEPHKINKDQLIPLYDNVIVSDMDFKERFVGRILLPSDDGKSSGIRPRWSQIYAVGPNQHELKVGQWILIEHGRWTRGIDIEDETGKHTLRRVDTKAIMMVSDEYVEDSTMSDKVSG